MEQVKVSVIVPNFNHAAFLDERIQSILSQSYQDFEVILLDDNSTDNSKDVIEKYRSNSKIKSIIYNQNNSGSAFIQWNKGLQLAKGKYIWIAESDDVCTDNLLETLVDLLEVNNETSIAYCKSIRIHANGSTLDDLMWWYKDIDEKKWREEYSNDGRNEINTALYKKNTIPNASAVLFRKDAAEKIGGAPLGYKLSGDWLFWIQLCSIGNVVYTTKSTNYFRTHARSVRSEESTNMTAVEEKLRIARYLTKHKLISKDLQRIIIGSIQLELLNRYRSKIDAVQKNYFALGKLFIKCLLLRSYQLSCTV